jgi:DNA-binding PadR family transcriptional regulator
LEAIFNPRTPDLEFHWMSLDHILLGLLQDPASGYDLKSTFDGTIRYFWAAELSQIYTTLQRLERDGLLSSTVEPSAKGPDRKVYVTTAAGLETLRSWILDEPSFGTERFGYLGQLFFMGVAKDPQRTLRFLKDLHRTFLERIETFRAIEVAWTEASGGDPLAGEDRWFHQFLALRAGIHAMTARAAWCEEAIDNVNRRIKRRKSTTKRKTKGTTK